MYMKMNLQTEVEKAISDVRDRKGTGDDYIPGNVLILLGEGGPRLMIPLINNLYDIEEWSRDFFEVTMIALKKKPKTTKCSDHCSQPYGTYSKDSKDTKKEGSTRRRLLSPADWT
jgi:hypothetical protein